MFRFIKITLAVVIDYTLRLPLRFIIALAGKQGKPQIYGQAPRKRVVATALIALCSTVLLLCEVSSTMNPGNDVERWWAYPDMWKHLAFPGDSSGTFARSCFTDGPWNDFFSLTGTRKQDQSNKIAQYTRQVREARAPLLRAVIKDRHFTIIDRFLGKDARVLREKLDSLACRPSCTHQCAVLPIPPNYLKRFWFSLMRSFLFQADPEDGSYFPRLSLAAFDPLWYRALLYDAEPWWLYVVCFPLFLLILLRFSDLWFAILFQKHKDTGFKLYWREASRLQNSVFSTALDLIILLTGVFFIAYPALSNIFLSWPQRVLFLMTFSFAYCGGLMLSWRLVFTAHKMSNVSEKRENHDQTLIKIAYFIIISLLLALAMVYQTQSADDRGRARFIAGACIWMIIAGVYGFYMYKAFPDRGLQTSIALFKQIAGGEDWPYGVAAIIASWPAVSSIFSTLL